MEGYATKEDTVAFLLSLGFTKVTEDFYDSPGTDEHGSVVQVFIYVCGNGYYCVDADGGYLAPVVWSGPRSGWDNQNQGDEFVEYLNKNHSGWR